MFLGCGQRYVRDRVRRQRRVRRMRMRRCWFWIEGVVAKETRSWGPQGGLGVGFGGVPTRIVRRIERVIVRAREILDRSESSLEGKRGC